MIELMVVVPVPMPELVTVPTLFSETVEMVIPPVLLALRVRLYGPVIPPDKVNNADPVLVKLFRFDVRVIALLTVRGDVPVSVIPVTFAPTAALMVVVPVLVPELVMVPMLLMLLEIVVAAVVPVPLIIRLPVPVMAPLKVSRLVKVGARVRLLFKVTAPLKILAALLVIFSVPLLPEATVIGLANVPTNPPFKVALALPLESPMVMIFAFAPKALALVVPETVPARMFKPVVKVFTPARVNCEVALF